MYHSFCSVTQKSIIINPTAPPVLPGQTDNKTVLGGVMPPHEWLAAGRNAGARTLSLGLDSGEELNWIHVEGSMACLHCTLPGPDARNPITADSSHKIQTLLV